MKHFYMVSSNKGLTTVKTLNKALEYLNAHLENYEKGSINRYKFIDEEEIEYELIWYKRYIKLNGRLYPYYFNK